MSPSCLALLLSLASACTLPGSPVTLRVALPPQPDLCVQYQDHAPLCVSRLVGVLS
ncbi:hypothetical protein [Stenotrophomonas rhizophila]|nr:hypothetical protein [Stenotrophomonas rhizophila]